MRTRYNDPHGLNPEDGSGGVEELEPVVVVGKRRSNYELYLERLRYGRQNGEDGPKFFDTDGENLRARINWVHEYHSRRREMNEDVGTAVVTIVTTAIPLGNLVKLKFLGKALQPLFVKFGNKSSIIIEGLLKRYAAKGGTSVIKGFTKHSANQAVERGFKTPDILKIVREGTPVEAMGRYGAQTRYTLGGNTVVVNAQGKVVTVFSNAPGTAKGLGKGHFIPFD